MYQFYPPLPRYEFVSRITFWRQNQTGKMEDMEVEPMEAQNSQEKSMEEEPRAGKTNRESRLMISKIVNENFKSYAGKQELGPFHKVKSTVVQRSKQLENVFKIRPILLSFGRVFPPLLGQMVVENPMS